jgi:GxxExxY protein
MDVDEVTGHVVDGALTVHRRIGPGLLESVYHTLLARELTSRGLRVERQKHVVFEYDGILFNEGLKLDLLVNDIVAVELKSVEAIAPVHVKQLLTYIRLLELPVGLLINFGGATLKEGLRRVVNNHVRTSPRLPNPRGSA